MAAGRSRATADGLGAEPIQSARRRPVGAHTVRNATVGAIRDARTAGIRPANAPIRMAEAMPPAHASTGITRAQPGVERSPAWSRLACLPAAAAQHCLDLLRGADQCPGLRRGDALA